MSVSEYCRNLATHKKIVMKKEVVFDNPKLLSALSNLGKIDSNLRNIKAEYQEAIIIEEVYTGTKTYGRKEWNKLLKLVRAEDTIVFDSVSRMSRNAEERFTIYKEMYEKGVNLVFLKEHHIDTSVYKKALENG